MAYSFYYSAHRHITIIRAMLDDVAYHHHRIRTDRKRTTISNATKLTQPPMMMMARQQQQQRRRRRRQHHVEYPKHRSFVVFFNQYSGDFHGEITRIYLKLEKFVRESVYIYFLGFFVHGRLMCSNIGISCVRFN